MKTARPASPFRVREGRLRRLVPLLALLLMAAAPPPGPAEAPEAHAARLLGELRQATGAAEWDPVKLLHVTARLGTAEETANEEAWLDLAGGRLLVSTDDGPGAGLAGFDGRTVWTAEIGTAVRSETGAARSDRLGDAFVQTLGWLRPSRVRPIYLRADTVGGRHCEVVQLTPEGSVPIELWLDRTSHLPVRAVEHGGASVQFSMWRKTQGVSLPWREEIATAGSEPHRLREITRVDVNPSFDPARFSAPASGPADFTFPREAASVELPMKLINGHVYIPARIGKLPLHMMFDTGSTLVLDHRRRSRPGWRPRSRAARCACPRSRSAGSRSGGRPRRCAICRGSPRSKVSRSTASSGPIWPGA